MKKFGKIASDIIGTVAPTLARALGGPLGNVAANVIEGVFNEPRDVIEKKLAEGHPETLLKLKEAEQNFELRMEELGVEESRLDVENTKDARAMGKATSVWFQFALTAVAMLAFGSVLYVLVLKSQIIPSENKDIVIFLVGQLSGFVALGYNFFLGSSKGSKESKDMAMGLQK